MAIYPYSFTLPPVNKQDIPSDGVVGEFLGISAGGVLDWLPVAGGSGTGDLLAANNLSELTPTAGTARTNLGLGTGDSPTFANLTLTSPSLSSSAPVTISQTWNNAAVAFTGLKVDATSTNSAASSKLLDLQVGTVSKFSVDKSGIIALPQTGGDASALICGGTAITNAAAYIGIYGIRLDSTSALQSSNGKNLNVLDTILLRDGAANTLALRNGALAQTFNVYGTYTSGVSYARLAISCDTSGNATLITQSTGAAGNLQITGQNELRLGVGSAWQWRVNSSGHFQAGTDNLYDIGASGANRPRNVYVANGLTTGSISPNSGTDLIFNGASTGAAWKITPSGHFHAFADNAYDIGASGANRPRNVYVGSDVYASVLRAGIWVLNPGAVHGTIRSESDGVFRITNSAINDFNRLQFGGTTNLFPSIKRNAAGLQIRLADDSANATLEAGNLYASGNVGIGTTAPGAKLQVGTHSGAVPSGSVVAIAGAVPRLSFSSNDDSLNYGGYILSNYAAGTFMTLGTRDSNVDTAALTLKNGNVGIGTTSPTSKLHVAGTIKPEQATMVDKAAGFTLAAVDAGTVINSTSATAITINLPAADTAAGYNVMIIQSGAGAVTINANGNTLNSFGNALITAGQHAACSIVRTAASTYNLSGNLV